MVTVDECTLAIFPAVSVEGAPVLPETPVTLQPDECTIVAVPITFFNTYRVVIRGDIDLDAKKNLEVSVTGGSVHALGFVEFADPTLFFRMDDFVED